MMDKKPSLDAVVAMTITYGCGHVEHKAIGDPIYDRCYICWPPRKKP